MMKHIYIFITFLTISFQLNAQNKVNLETSVNFGLASFQTDYGERGNFKSGVSGNTGLAFGLGLYVNFFNKDPMHNNSPSWLQKHLKLRLETSYLSAKLNHFGVDEKLLKGMSGKSKIINFGGVFEYHLFDIPDFIPGKQQKISPYFGFGAMAGYSIPSLEVKGGDWEKNEYLLIEPYRGDAANVEASLVYSLVFSSGFRYNLKNDSAIIIDLRWQSFTSDYVDGLNPSIDANKYNDWLYYLNVGYVFKFGGTQNGTTW